MHVLSGWSVHSTFTYGDFLDSLQMCRGRDCVEKFVEHIEDEVKKLYETFPQCQGLLIHQKESMKQ